LPYIFKSNMTHFTRGGAFSDPSLLSMHLQIEERSVERIPLPPTLTRDLDLPKFNHLVPCGQEYDWRSLVTIGLELAPGSCSQTYRRRRKQPPITFGRKIIITFLNDNWDIDFTSQSWIGYAQALVFGAVHACTFAARILATVLSMQGSQQAVKLRGTRSMNGV